MLTIADYRKFGTVTPTRFQFPTSKLYICHVAPSMWRFVVDEEGMAAAVGPQFKTKLEAFSELTNYAKTYYGDWV